MIIEIEGNYGKQKDRNPDTNKKEGGKGSVM
jgi:hypothetical protein